mmetsp:Transcript_2373/g.6377  ORF Transcript_2373/g.6377 Transcript_2373/m.6377 type:complete len:98 (+) Transcript_2373:10-303(+)
MSCPLNFEASNLFVVSHFVSKLSDPAVSAKGQSRGNTSRNRPPDAFGSRRTGCESRRFARADSAKTKGEEDRKDSDRPRQHRSNTLYRVESLVIVVT